MKIGYCVLTVSLFVDILQLFVLQKMCNIEQDGNIIMNNEYEGTSKSADMFCTVFAVAGRQWDRAQNILLGQ
jgi:hypothetical protein